MNKLFKFTACSFLAVALAGVVATSCSNDDMGPSIFDTTEYPLDRTKQTFPLDTFCKVNFLEPYNLKYMYLMEDKGSNMDYNLIPCSYDQSITLAVLCKYLWYDVYKDSVDNGLIFLKKYSPRIIHVIGSPAYNPVQGTMELGTAEGGLKITLYNANSMSPNDISYMNEYFFKTMHHEFSHILHQNINYPTDFNLISRGRYEIQTWNDTPDSVCLGRGFVSPYASSQPREDWVEIIANYIVKDTITWNHMLNTASFEWEIADDVDAAYWKKLDAQAKAGMINRDSVGYYLKTSSTSGTTDATYSIVRKSIQRDADNKYAVTDEDGNIVFIHPSGQDGRTTILQKLAMAKEWLLKNYNYDLDKVRMGVQRRQWLTDANGNFVFDANGDFINNLTYTRADGTTVLDSLRQQVLKFKELQK
ncbi:MAG: hypothetical protein KBS99_02845 [Prevotellaceae bacterium]|nr:hypothetical protein [Candidatus Colivivens caballi]